MKKQHNNQKGRINIRRSKKNKKENTKKMKNLDYIQKKGNIYKRGKTKQINIEASKSRVEPYERVQLSYLHL